MNRRSFLKLTGTSIITASLAKWNQVILATDKSVTKKPNIVFILADDIGYGDFGCYGATQVKTPNVDRLAQEGIRFTDAHATGAVCTPTRYSLIIGQYAWRNPKGAAILDGEAPLAIDITKPTTASLLKQAGYTTGLVGKWHIGLGNGAINWNTDIKPGPCELGFDYAYYYPATGDRVPCIFIENHRVVGLDPNDPIKVSYKGRIGNEPTGKDHPELLTLKSLSGHDGTIINGISRIGYMSGGKTARWKDNEMADRITTQAVSFIEKNKHNPFFLYLAPHNIHAPRVPHARYKGTSGCGTRGDAIQEFDGCVGTVLSTLERLKLEENTLVIVTSDNGGIIQDGYRDGSVVDAHGHLCNGRLRGYKGSLWEGGHRVPFIARWPGKIKAGAESAELIGLVDMLATFSAAAEQNLPADAGPDSFNVLPSLLGGKTPRDHLVLQSNGIERLSLRYGQWKFIPGKLSKAHSTSNGAYSTSEEVQLYDLSSDLSEQNNLADKHPDLVEKFTKMMKKIKADGSSRPS